LFKKKYFTIVILLIAILGSFLRLFQIDKQVIGDDEWHGIFWATKASFSDILTHFHGSDNCIPLTAYYKLLLETIGLSEFGLHSLQILSGILSLIIFPFIIKSIFQKRISITFSFLLAISPFLIYYSRYARPYSIVVFLSFISIFSFYFWIKKNKKCYIIIYLLTATIAPYFHLFSLIPVITPLLYTATFHALEKRFFKQSDKTVYPKLIHIFYVGILLLIGLMVVFLPTINSLGAIWQKVSGYEREINSNTIIGAVNLFNGVESPLISIVFTSLFIYGLYLSYVKNKFLFGYLFSILSLQFLSLLILRPDSVQESIVFGRYSICCLPLWVLFISVGLDDTSLRLGNLISKKGNKIHSISNIFLIGCFLAIFLKGPIVTIYKNTNNFTNHNDFQNNYLYSWTKTDLNSLENPIPKFYFYLKETKDSTIIETPFITSWIGNNYHIYQRLHAKNVIIGHTGTSYLLYSYYWQSVPIMHPNIRLNNFVNIEDFEEIAKSNSSYIVVHKDLLNEFFYMRKNFPDNDFKQIAESIEKNREVYDISYGLPAKTEAEQSIKFLKQTFGDPFYEDTLIVVFKIK
jgi:uncharacterized membrane protein